MNRLFALVMVEGENVIKYESLLTDLFRRVQSRIRQYYNNRLLSRLSNFMGSVTWEGRDIFFDEYCSFLIKLFDATCVMLSLPDIGSREEMTLLYFANGRKLKTSHFSDLARKICNDPKGEIVNLIHFEDYHKKKRDALFEFLLESLEMEEDPFTWPTLAFPVRDGRNRILGAVKVICRQPFSDVNTVFSNFHVGQARLLGDFAGKTLELLDDRKSVILTVQDILHNTNKYFAHKYIQVKNKCNSTQKDVSKFIEEKKMAIKEMLDALLSREKVFPHDPFSLLNSIIEKPLYPKLNIDIQQPIFHQQVFMALKDMAAVMDNILSNIQNVADIKKANAEVCIRIIKMNNGKTNISITDNLGGFPDEVMESFPKTLLNLKQVNGSGMGLFLCHKRMRRMGGEMTICNNDEGAQVNLMLRTVVS